MRNAVPLYEEMIVPEGTPLFKGLRGKDQFDCKKPLPSTKVLYLTNKPDVARLYTNTYLCEYVTTVPLRLWILSRRNITTLVSKNLVSQELASLLKFVTGTMLTKANQQKQLLTYNQRHHREFKNPSNAGERISIYEVDKKTFGMLCREFLVPNGYHGYFAPEKPSEYHGTTSFHSEIMLCNVEEVLATQTQYLINKNTPRKNIKNVDTWQPTPIQSLEEHVPRAFREYAKTHNIQKMFQEMRGDAKEWMMMLSGGMAMKLWIESHYKSQNVPAKYKIDTNDFDFMVATSAKFSDAEGIATYVNAVKDFMTSYFSAFVAAINKDYGMTQLAQLEVRPNIYKTERTQLGKILDRKVYAIVSYFVKVPYSDESIDLADLAIVQQADAGDHWIDTTASKYIGLPIPHMKYLLRDATSVFINAIITNVPYNKELHFISGKRKEKGQKLLKRINILCGVSKDILALHQAKFSAAFNAGHANMSRSWQRSVDTFKNLIDICEALVSVVDLASQYSNSDAKVISAASRLVQLLKDVK